MRGYEVTDKDQTVLALDRLNISGHIVPENWFRHLLRENGKPHLAAILILADIVYWHRLIHERDENTGEALPPRKRFMRDKLQRYVSYYEKMYGLSDYQVRSSLEFLRDRGIITQELRVIEMPNGAKVGNVPFIDINVPALSFITYEEPEGAAKPGDNNDDAPEVDPLPILQYSYPGESPRAMAANWQYTENTYRDSGPPKAEPAAPPFQEPDNAASAFLPRDATDALATANLAGVGAFVAPTTRKGPRDPTQLHPAVLVWREVMMINHSNKDQRRQIIETVGDDAGALALWRETLKDWRLRNWGNTNLPGMLERFKNPTWRKDVFKARATQNIAAPELAPYNPGVDYWKENFG